MEWADYYQRIEVRDEGQEVNLKVVYEDEDGDEHESEVWMDIVDFRKLVKKLYKIYG